MKKEKFNYRRILIIGCSGAGKSTLAAKLGGKLNIPVVNLDRMWWLPNWEHTTKEDFDRQLEKELINDSWIIDGDYARTFSTRLTYADFCIFLDYPTDLCLKSAYERFLKYRGRTRPDMTDGCEEQFDSEFQEWIKTYRGNIRPVMLSHLAASDVPYKIFTDRAQTELWLSTI